MGRKRRKVLEFEPMNTRTAQLWDEALALAPEDRSALVVALVDSLDGEDEEQAAIAWATEVEKRRSALHSGAEQPVSWTDARQRLSAL